MKIFENKMADIRVYTAVNYTSKELIMCIFKSEIYAYLIDYLYTLKQPTQHMRANEKSHMKKQPTQALYTYAKAA
jgi:hypothetical protein